RLVRQVSRPRPSRKSLPPRTAALRAAARPTADRRVLSSESPMTCRRVLWFTAALLALMVAGPCSAAVVPSAAFTLPWAGFVETNFPFFSSVLDARKLGHDFPADNLTPRGLILNLGNDCWACFDTDLLRMAAIWNGKGLSAISMAQGS